MSEVVGTIEDFDERRGDGHLLGDDGVRYYLHCVAISDGSRSIALGVRARGRRSVGRLGRDEVIDLTMTSSTLNY